MAVCINCSILLRSSLQLHEYWAMELSPELVLIAEEWCGREVTDSDRLCHECVILVAREAENHIESRDRSPNRQLGHTCVCISCGISLGRRTGRRRHRLHERSEERNYIAIQIFPRQVPDEAFVCHACWMRAYENIMRQPIEPDVALPSSEPMEPSLRETIPDLPSPPQVEARSYYGEHVRQNGSFQVEVEPI